MNGKYRKYGLRYVCFLCALLSVFMLFSCSDSSDKNEKKSVKITDTTVLAIACEPFSGGFYAAANILNAANDAEYAVGLLASETIMRKNKDGGWTEKNGSITTALWEGRTVATVRLNKTLKTANGQSLMISDYISLVQQITRRNYNGYFKDFYLNPIEGLIAYRYDCPGLTLADLPDFDALTRDKIAALTKEDYAQLLLDTSIGGLFENNASALSYDGRTFRQAIEEYDSKFDFTTASQNAIRSKLAKIYAQRPKSEWITDLLYDSVKDRVIAEFCEQKKQEGATGSAAISISKSDNYTCKVVFEKVVSEDEAIGMLNLPLCFQAASRRKGDYVFRKNSEGTVGRALSFTDQGGSLTVLSAAEEDLVDSVALGQIRAAVLLAAPSETLTAKAKERGLRCEAIGSGYAIYDANLTERSFLEGLAIFYF